MLWLLLACAKQRPPADSAAAIPIDSTETGDSSDLGPSDTADSGVSPVTIWPVDGPCGAWSGVQRTGTTWAYAASDAYVASYAMDGGYTTFATVTEDGIVTLVSTGSYTGEYSSFSYSRTDTWRCDPAGAWWTRNESNSNLTTSNGESTISGWRSFTPGWLVRPSLAEVGATWTDLFVLEGEVNGVESAPQDVSCVSNVSLEELRIVEAGEFTARRVDTDCDVSSDSSRWLTHRLGMLETDDEELIAYVP